MEKEFKHLGPTGTHAFGWIAQDLNVDGGVGDAGKATAEKGEKTAEHQIDGFIALLRDMTAFSLNRLYTANADSNSLTSPGRNRAAIGSPTRACLHAC